MYRLILYHRSITVVPTVIKGKRYNASQRVLYCSKANFQTFLGPRIFKGEYLDTLYCRNDSGSSVCDRFGLRERREIVLHWVRGQFSDISRPDKFQGGIFGHTLL
jgi:hypothetical protein